MDKLVIAVRDRCNSGKTETLRNLAVLISNLSNAKITDIRGKEIEIPEKGDIMVIAEINGLCLGIVTKGDPNTPLDYRLNQLNNKNCSLIFCGCRNDDDPVYIVRDFCKRNAFELVWTSTYRTDVKKNHSKLNGLKAKQLLELANELGYEIRQKGDSK